MGFESPAEWIGAVIGAHPPNQSYLNKTIQVSVNEFAATIQVGGTSITLMVAISRRVAGGGRGRGRGRGRGESDDSSSTQRVSNVLILGLTVSNN